MFQHMTKLRQSIWAKKKTQIRVGGAIYKLRPLALDYWGRLWTLAAWSEATSGFMTLRIDLIDSADIIPAAFVDEAGKTLIDYLSWNKAQNLVLIST